MEIRWKLHCQAVVTHALRSHSKSTFVRNFQFLTLSPSCSFLFILHVPKPPPNHSHSTYVRFGELPLLSQKKVPRRLWHLFRKKIGGWKVRKQFFFCKLYIKDQWFLHSYICNDNTNIYMFIKKWKKKKNV